MLTGKLGGKSIEMSRFDSKMQEKFMSWLFRGKEIFKPLNTGKIDDHVSCIREFVANIFFYTKNGTTIMIDAGYNYERLQEKMSWLNIRPDDIKHILITHQDTDHVGAIEDDSDLLFKDALIYVSEQENRYLTGEIRRKVMYGMSRLSLLHISNHKRILKDSEVFYINDIKVEAILVPGHTWGHMVYLIDDRYLFTGDTIWFGADGGYSFIDSLAEDNKLAVRSLEKLEKLLKERGIKPVIITGHTGYSDDLDYSFAHRAKLCKMFGYHGPHDPDAPYDGYDESDDTEEKARTVMLKKKNREPDAHE
jgi:glyoxylase-like metal-dependent hydrolase (beta-lactamase superfamily II)